MGKNTSYVKEVQAVINEGLPEEVAIELFQALTEQFEGVDGHAETEQFKQNLLHYRKYDLVGFRRNIDKVCQDNPLPIKLNWRKVKYQPKRIKRCEICGYYFYDVSRNGRKLTCDRYGEYFRFDFTNRTYRYYYKNGVRLSDCAAEYERRRRTGSVLYPNSNRKPYEVLIDFQPSENNKQGHALLNEVEMTAWKNRLN
ncbi:hypothetical protein ACTWQB_08815 [Piscibacillus sp. B03]|uniref:hypothetical protein n=1 Tax=Piscibacillus sp. B03 TaxID=3457430 RepID=UPI003FCD55EF